MTILIIRALLFRQRVKLEKLFPSESSPRFSASYLKQQEKMALFLDKVAR